MPSPLSGTTYGSRHLTDIVAVTGGDKTHRNMVTVNFYGGTSLQAQELNEIQEQIQQQLVGLNKLLERWPNEQGTKLEAFRNVTNPVSSVITVDPRKMTVSSPNPNGEITINLDAGLHLINTSLGFQYFVNGITLNGHSNSYPAIEGYANRYINSSVSGWNALEDSSSSSLDKSGAGRLQYYNIN
jgi:hypothetical protein